MAIKRLGLAVAPERHDCVSSRASAVGASAQTPPFMVLGHSGGQSGAYGVPGSYGSWRYAISLLEIDETSERKQR